jgi:5-methylcytosine-specific restriction endonuclease McrA
MTEWANRKERLRQRFRKRVREKVLKRDNNKCRICGAKENLTVHHIRSISSCIKKRKEHLIRDKNNLVTLCETCHHKAPNGRSYYRWELNKKTK